MKELGAGEQTVAVELHPGAEELNTQGAPAQWSGPSSLPSSMLQRGWEGWWPTVTSPEGLVIMCPLKKLKAKLQEDATLNPHKLLMGRQPAQSGPELAAWGAQRSSTPSPLSLQCCSLGECGRTAGPRALQSLHSSLRVHATLQKV